MRDPGRVNDLICECCFVLFFPFLSFCLLSSSFAIKIMCLRLSFLPIFNLSLQIADEDEEGREGSYQALRKAVLEYRGTMKEYYKAVLFLLSILHPLICIKVGMFFV